MNGQYEYSPHIWPSILTVLLLIALAIYSWRRRSVPGAQVFALSCLFAAFWAAGALMEAAAVDLPTKIFWIKFQGLWKLPTATVSTCFVLEYAWPGRWLTRRNMVLLSIPPLLMAGMILTDDIYHLIWRGFAYAGDVIPQRTSINWIFFGYGYLLGAVNLFVLGWLFLHSPSYRWPVVIMLIGQLVGRGVFLLEVSRIVQSGLLVEVPAPALEYLIYAIALFGFRIFDPVPLARQTAIEQAHAGILVLDREGQVVSLNPAAERILGVSVSHARGRPASELLTAYQRSCVDIAGETEELTQSEGSKSRYYLMETSRLQDFRGLEVGRLLMLRDVTERKQAESQLVEHQRALTTLQERELLARDLHDSIGQVLGFASLKMGAIRKLIADGKLAKADEQLEHLESLMAESHADVREYILNLRNSPTEEKHLFSALRQYLDGFQQNYGFHVELSVCTGLDEDVVEPAAQLQLFHILQEALSNARKHAATDSVQIMFERYDSLLCMRVQDRGKGFDPITVTQMGGDHFGLEVMRERAVQMGGTLRVRSTPGEGTCIEVEVPVHGEEPEYARVDRR